MFLFEKLFGVNFKKNLEKFIGQTLDKNNGILIISIPEIKEYCSTFKPKVLWKIRAYHTYIARPDKSSRKYYNYYYYPEYRASIHIYGVDRKR